MHMHRVLAGTECGEGDGLPTLEQTAPLAAGNFKRGRPASNSPQFHHHGQAPREEKRDHFREPLLDSSPVTMETHPWKLLPFQGNSYKQ